MYLQRSKLCPLHIKIWKVKSDEQSWFFSSAASKIVCMTIVDGCCTLLQGQFPVLERLELDLGPAEGRRLQGWQYLSRLCQSPQLQELRLVRVPGPTLVLLSTQLTGFVVLQKLEISCGCPSDWINMIQGASKTLLSLVLRLWHGSTHPAYQLSLPRLRHLQITRVSDRAELVLDIDAPHLESVEERFGVGSEGRIVIRLRDPRSVKHLRIERQRLDLPSYPALRKLWITGNMQYNFGMLHSLMNQIAFCWELEAVLDCALPQLRQR